VPGGFAPKPQSPAGSGSTVCRKILAQIPTVFGQLAFLASLRDAQTGRYSHEPLNRMLGSEDADRALCNSHHQVFSQWISSSLSEQMEDLDRYARAVGGRRQVLEEYRKFIPATARPVERQLYLTDLETLLELLRLEVSGAS